MMFGVASSMPAALPDVAVAQTAIVVVEMGRCFWGRSSGCSGLVGDMGIQVELGELSSGSQKPEMCCRSLCTWKKKAFVWVAWGEMAELETRGRGTWPG